MIQVRQCSKAYDGQHVLRHIDLRIVRGEFLGIIGPNGCGKTTFLRLMSGEERPDDGAVELGGHSVEQWPARERAKRLTVVTQEGLPPVPFSVYDVVMMGRHIYQARFRRPSVYDRTVVRRVLTATGLQHIADKSVAHVSGGERQRVAIARAMAQEPHVLLLDEPTTYLDIGYQLSILEYVQNWQRQTGATVITVLHDLNLAAQFCERLVLMNSGRIIADGTPADVLQADILEKVYHTRPYIIRHPHSGLPQVLLGSQTAPSPDPESPPLEIVER